MKLSFHEMSDTNRHRLAVGFKSRAPFVLPATWRVIESFSNAYRCFRDDGLHVILEMELIRGRDRSEAMWLHLSVSYKNVNKMPTYDDLTEVKDLFIGRTHKAIMVLPREVEHYNFRTNCLHLYSPHQHDPLPDFRYQDGSL